MLSDELSMVEMVICAEQARSMAIRAVAAARP